MANDVAEPRATLTTVLTDEGLRLFFPLAALQLALWPMLWTLIHRFDLPFAQSTPPIVWHAHEMLIGGFGAALIGFITTAVPEWTGTDRVKGRPLLAMAVLWAVPRVIGLGGADFLIPIAALLDTIWLAALVAYVLHVSWHRRTTRLLAFAGWIAGVCVVALAMQIALIKDDIALAQTLSRITALLFAGLLGLALARIAVPVTNLVLDASERTSPFRPHPGRLNIAPGLTAVAIGAEAVGLSHVIQGYLWIAAGAAFMDRVAETFVGKAAFRSEILGMAVASALAGSGLMLVGAGRLGAPIPESASLHVLLMGGVGTGVLSVLAIAGRLHTGQKLGLTPLTKLAFVMLVSGTLLRVAPDLGFFNPPGPAHGLASVVWASAFFLWLKDYWPALSDPKTLAARTC